VFRCEAGLAHTIEKRAFARQPDRTLPAAPPHRGKQFRQALLGSAGIAELIEQQDSHGRTASASTKK
jgi:hypothetical protein